MPSLIRDSTITLAMRLVTLVIAFAATVVISRALGPAQVGSYNIVVLLVTVVSLVTAMGVQVSIVFFGARNPQELPGLIGMALVLGIGVGILGGGLLFAATSIPLFSQYLVDNAVPPGLMAWMILILPIMQVNAYMPEILRAAGRIARYNLLTLWQYLALLIAAVILIPRSDQNAVEAAVAAFTISQLAGAVLAILFAVQVTHYRVTFQWRNVMESIRFGLRLHPASIAQFLNYRLDLFLVGVFLLPQQVGYYATATLLAERLWEPPSAIQQVLLYQVSAKSSSAAMMTARASRVITLLMGVLCLGVVLFSYPLIPLIFGSAFAPSIPALIFLMPGVWMLGLSKVLGAYLVGIGRPEIGTLAAIISLISTVIFDIILIPRLGIIGGSLSSSISYSIFTLIVLGFFVRATGLSVKEVIVVRRMDFTTLFGAFTKAVQRLRPSGNLPVD